MKIILVTGGINSGKTSWILENVGKDSVVGVSQLKLYLGRVRVGYDVFNLSSREYLPLARHRDFIPADWDEEFIFGDFSFSSSGIYKGREWLREAVEISKEYKIPLVVDEVGPVEIKCLGFYDVVVDILNEAGEIPELYIVVRKRVVQGVLKTFNISNFDTVDVEDYY